MNRNWKPPTILFLALVAGLIAFYWPWLSGQKAFYQGDVTLFFEPLCRYIGDAIRQGRFPLWNPLSYCGMSQVAIPSPGLFYLPNYLFALLPFSQALAWQMVFHQLVAAIGTYALIASFGWGALAGAAGAVVVSLSGYMFSLEGNYTLVAAAAWCPVALWCFLRLDSDLTGKNVSITFATALATFMLICSGRPEIVAPAIAIILAGIVFSFWHSCRSGNDQVAWRRALWQLAALLIGILLSAPQILPTLEWLSVSRRSQGLGLHEAFLYSANWYDMLCLFAAHPLGDLHLHAAKFLPLATTQPRLIPYLSSAYVGPVAITFALWGILDRQWKYRWFFLIFLIATIVIALGDQTPIMPLLATGFPALAYVRFPVKLLYFVILIVAILASRGMSALIEDRVSKVSHVVACLVWLGTLIVGTILFTLSLNKIVAFPFSEMWWFQASTNDLSMQAEAAIGIGVMIASTIGLLSCLVAQLCRSKVLSPKNAGLMLIGLLAATMFGTSFVFDRHQADSHYFARPSYLNDQLVNLFKHDIVLSPRISGLYLELFTCPPWWVGGKPHPATANWYQYSRQMLRPNTNMDFNMPSAFGYEGAMVGDYFDLYLSAYLKSTQNPQPGPTEFKYRECSDIPFARLCEVTGSKYVVTQKFIFRAAGGKPEHVANLDPKFFELVVDDAAMNARVYRVLASRQRVYFIPSWQSCASHADALKQMQSLTMYGPDPQPLVLIEGFNGQIPGSADVSRAAGMCNIVLESDKPELLSLKVDTNFPGWLVVADQYYPGWQATVDQKPSKIYRANAIQRALLLSAGSHAIEFKYQPESLTWGIRLAIFALCILALLFIMSIIKDKRKGKGNE
jgi:hypothetical protein